MRLTLPAVLVLLAGCAPTPAPEVPPVIGLANPASVNCLDNGGRSEIRNTPSGQIGVCVFHDGRQCEEWALVRDHRCVAP